MPARTTTIARNDSRRRLIIAVATFLLISFLVIRTSDAAFTANHVNEDNAFAAASIALDGSETIPLFGDGAPASVADASALYPGNTVEACIDITYTGDLDTGELQPVDLSIAGATGALADGLTVTVDRLDSCTAGTVEAGVGTPGALSAFPATATGWTPSGDGDARGFLFTVEVDDTDALQGESLTGVDITWSLESS